MSYVGNTVTTQGFIPAVDYFNGTGSATAFTLSKPVASVAQVQAVISNVVQNPSDAYTVSGNTITFTSAPPTGTNNVYVYYTSPITQVIAPGQGTVTTTSFASSTGTGAVVLATSPTITTPTLTSPIITGSAPQVTTYTSGSGTYTTPANARYLQIKLVGGGAGGSGGGTGGGGTGGAGGTTTFGTSLLTANGGSGGVWANRAGIGGTATNNASGIAVSGGGGNGSGYQSVSNGVFTGGNGGSSAFGGGAYSGIYADPGASGAANTGGGGAGGGGGNNISAYSGTGGGAGGYVDAIITSPSATYSYAVGAAGTAGTAGTGGFAGGAGGSGVIFITAYF